MSTYERCPVCEGAGVVSRPPGVPADQESFTTTSTGPWTCPTCNGVRVIPSYPMGPVVGGAACPDCPPKTILHGKSWKCGTCGATGDVTPEMRPQGGAY